MNETIILKRMLAALTKMPDTIYQGAIIKCADGFYIVDEASIETADDGFVFDTEITIKCHGLQEECF